MTCSGLAHLKNEHNTPIHINARGELRHANFKELGRLRNKHGPPYAVRQANYFAPAETYQNLHKLLRSCVRWRTELSRKQPGLHETRKLFTL
jgi:hypothetical protein